jgi:RHS repeat-associated protein
MTGYQHGTQYRDMLWDEENRLQGVNDNGMVSQYTYDDSGERVIKSSGGTESMFVNGANIGSFGHEKNYTGYLSPYFVFKEGSFTKHYYIGAQRIVSKIGNGRFDNNSGLNGNGITAGGINFAKQQSWYDKKVEEYIASLGIPPGPPDKKGIYGSPEYTGQPYPDFGSPLNESNEPPLGWPKVPVFNQPGDVPGPPIKWGDPVTNDNVEAGWGYEGTGVIEETDLYFYHPDHLGSTSYVTTRLGKVSQHVEYIPFGEVFLEEKNDKWNTPYKFNSKELDDETGLYYFSSRYFDSKLSLFYSVDPLAEQTMTPYQYCYQNPINLIDPTGMSPEGVDGWGLKDNQWIYDENITEDNYKDLGYSDYSDGVTNNTYTSVKNTKITLKSDGTWSENGLTSTGQAYGGDGSGSFMDWVLRVIYETDQYNPIALAWDGIEGYITGSDRFGNELNTSGSTYKVAMAVPVFKVGGIASKGLGGVVQITKHAAERMVERGITQKMVETGISKGTKYLDPKNGTFNYVLKDGFASGKDLLIGVSPQTGKVTTVLRGNNLVNKRFIPQ